ncbi:MAG: transporter [Janthinobacterium lividum]
MARSIARSLFLAAAVAAMPAFAQDSDQTGAGQEGAAQGTGPLPSPNVAPSPTPICTDRPTKANVACTVPAGDVQVEADAINWTRLSVAGTQTDTVLYTNPYLKLGVGTHTDLEVNIAPYETVRTRDAAGVASTLGGVGDLYLRVKQRLTSDAAKTQVSLIPYVKAPTARLGIGNGQWEGGVIAAANIPIPAGFTLTVGPEVDVLADGDGSGHHANLVMLANLSHPIGKKITAYGEFWTGQNLDPAGHVQQYSLDTAVAYLISPTWQVDLGGNFGLNRATPGSQLYLGVSTRF